MRVGLDVGSTTIKCVVLDDRDKLIYSTYERHYSHIVEKSAELLRRVAAQYGREAVFAISGSAGMGMAESVKAPFVQEVFATRVAANRLAPGTDVIIELGGEDAKILFLTGGHGGADERLLRRRYRRVHRPDGDSAEHGRRRDGRGRADERKRPIPLRPAAACLPRAISSPSSTRARKTDDIAASIYQAVVNQTIAGLAQGRPIKGNILYLGGPLTFSQAACGRALTETLGVNGTCPENSLLFVALGAAFLRARRPGICQKTAELLEQHGMSETYRSQPPLFDNQAEYDAFKARHARAAVPQTDFPADYAQPVHIGIDSGSTTVKVAVIDEDANLLFTDYRPNQGNPIALLQSVLLGAIREPSRT